MRYKRYITGAALLMMAAMITAVMSGCNKEQAEYAVAADDIADTFPLEAKESDGNPQLVDSDGPYAVFHTTAGDITVVLYPEQAPMAVENFIGLVDEGYYDGSLVNYVKKNDAVQAGLPADGSEERSLWGSFFDDEFSDELHHFPGALSMSASGHGCNKSQFFFSVSDEEEEDELLIAANMYYNELLRQFTIEASARNDESPMTEEELEEFEKEANEKVQAINEDGVPEEYLSRYQPAIEKYKEVGGSYFRDYDSTVFGQIIDGYNVASAMSQVLVDANRTPKQEMKIESIEILKEKP